MVFYIFIFFLGMFTGGLFVKYIFSKKSSGILKCNTEDPDGPYLFLVPLINVNDMIKKDIVIFKVQIDK